MGHREPGPDHEAGPSPGGSEQSRRRCPRTTAAPAPGSARAAHCGRCHARSRPPGMPTAGPLRAPPPAPRASPRPWGCTRGTRPLHLGAGGPVDRQLVVDDDRVATRTTRRRTTSHCSSGPSGRGRHSPRRQACRRSRSSPTSSRHRSATSSRSLRQLGIVHHRDGHVGHPSTPLCTGVRRRPGPAQLTCPGQSGLHGGAGATPRGG